MASERVIAGLEVKRLDDRERRIVAYHESGHAVVAWFLKHASPLVKVTIIPRSKGALGFTQYVPDNHKLHSKEHLKDMICAIFGGRIAEEVLIGSITTGASDDLQKATGVAHAMVTKYGMSNIGLRVLPSGGEDEIMGAKPYSEKYEQKIDEEVNAILEECYQIAKDIVITHKDKLVKMGEKLLEKETIDLVDVIECLGERPFPMEDFMKEYLDQVTDRKKQEEEKKLAEQKKKEEEARKSEEKKVSEGEEKEVPKVVTDAETK
jgi:AFG3 family protein